MIDFQSIFSDKCIQNFNPYSQHVFDQLARCHTAKMGVHRLRCDATNCAKEQYQFHSCGNRNCPNCGGLKVDQWIENRTHELLPTPYYHLVFTLPHEFNGLIIGNRKQLFKLLFDAASETILNHSKMPEYLGSESGITMVLHTWGQNLSFHPHVHCIVTGGGFDGDKWSDAKGLKNNFLFPEDSLKKMYKAIFLKKIKKLDLEKGAFDLNKIIKITGYKKWNVYAKAPFGGPAQVVEYLGRYTHKIAITKHRILGLTDTHITFKYKDYADGNKTKNMTLLRSDFLQRFEMHILPKRFTKIRHYGFLQNHGKRKRLSKIRALLNLTPLKEVVVIPSNIRMLERFGIDIFLCPCCKIGRLESVSSIRYKKSQTQEFLEIEQVITNNNKASPF
jgi:hypothetical protein